MLTKTFGANQKRDVHKISEMNGLMRSRNQRIREIALKGADKETIVFLQSAQIQHSHKRKQNLAFTRRQYAGIRETVTLQRCGFH